jgi:hypothetical protein
LAGESHRTIDPHALKIPARRAEYSLTENAASPFHAEPRHDMYRRSALREDDLLLSIRGTAGRVCRVPANLDGANITQDTARISVHPEVASNYIEIIYAARALKNASKLL